MYLMVKEGVFKSVWVSSSHLRYMLLLHHMGFISSSYYELDNRIELKLDLVCVGSSA